MYIYGDICMYFLFKTVCLLGFPRKISILSPVGLFISSVRNLLLGLTPENFFKI